MRVFHAVWSSSCLLVWAEDSLARGRSGKAGSKSGSKTAAQAPPSRRWAPKPHPFAASPSKLFRDVENIAKGLAYGDHPDQKVTLTLPTSAGCPLASPQYPADHGIDRAAVYFTPWHIPAILCTSDVALELLLALPAEPPAGLIWGDSLKFFADVARLAIEFVARGRVMPILDEPEEDHLFGVWRPVVELEEDVDRLKLLARSMPPMCRAEVSRLSPKESPASTIVRQAFESLTDAAVRRTIRDVKAIKPGKPAARGVAANPAANFAIRWVKALQATNELEARVTWRSGKETLRFIADLGKWNTQATATDRAQLRTCFRLSAPEQGAEPETEKAGKAAGGAWGLEFLLQAVDDKSLLIPASAVWKTRGQVLTFSSRRVEDPQEKLLADLGRAYRLYPGLERALKTARPSALAFDATGAYQFLKEAAPMLEQAGFGIITPPWWKKPARLGLKLKTRPKAAAGKSHLGLLGMDGICDYQWQIAIADQTLSFEDFEKLASLKVPLVQMRGQWVELKQDDIQAALAFFQKNGTSGEMSVGEALRIGMGIENAGAGLEVVGAEGEGWLASFFKQDGAQTLKKLPAPGGFTGTLRPYQERGLSWLSFLNDVGLGACLADDMGLGKTIQLLALLLAHRPKPGSQKNGDSSTLLVCPMSVVGNWQRETQRFAPELKVYIHHGANRVEAESLNKAVKNQDLVITTYSLVARDQAALSELAWTRVVLDEAQNIKNSGARQTQAIRSLKTAHRIALTGTPVENRLSELWSIMQFLNPGLLGSAKEFQQRFATPIEKYRDKEKAALLKRITGPFVLRRLKTDKTIIKDLPDKIEMKVHCNLTREQASLYQAVIDEMLKKVEESEGIERKGLVLSTLLKLKQVCNHPAQLLQDGSTLAGRSGKLALLEDTLEEALAEGDKVLCFTQFSEMGRMLVPHLQERFSREVMFLYGGTPRTARDRMVERFQDPGGPQIFLLSLKAGGTGLNLTAARHVVHFDRWWNPAVEDQATDRAFRIGQRRNVQVRKFVCVGTLEERIDQMIEAKKELAELTVGTGEGWLTELTTSQLRELIALSPDAVSEG